MLRNRHNPYANRCAQFEDMNYLYLEIDSNEDVWEFIDQEVSHVLLDQFWPNEAVEWWKTSFNTKHGTELADLTVRQMAMDIQTDLVGLKKVLDLNTQQLRIYQFDKPVSDTLVIDNLPEGNKNQILKENGLRHLFFLDFEVLTIGSFDTTFLNEIKTNPKFELQDEKNK